MTDLFIYLSKSFISLGIFYIAYIAFLQRQNNFAINRAYLLITLILSFFIPEIKVNLLLSQVAPIGQVFLDTITVVEKPFNQTVFSGILLFDLAKAIYFAGLSFFCARFLWRIGQLCLLIFRNGTSSHKGLKVIFTSEDIAPFSFFNIVFISKMDKEKEHIHEILLHEKAHINLLHSVDIILIECIGVLQWFNPFVWLYKQSIQHIHEYQADRQVIRNGNDRFHYQQILFTQTTGIPYNSIVNSFNQSLLKKRLIMMKKEKPTKWTSLRMLITIPLVAGLLMAFTTTKGTAFSIINEINPELVQDTIKKLEDQVFTVVEVMPVFSKGGEEGLKKYIATNVKYPENSRKEGIQGKVYVSFVVDEKGKVTNVKEARTKAIKPKSDKESKMVSCAAPELTKEALRVISSLPDFTPGKQKGKAVKVAYTVPINFLLDSDKKK